MTINIHKCWEEKEWILNLKWKKKQLKWIHHRTHKVITHSPSQLPGWPCTGDTPLPTISFQHLSGRVDSWSFPLHNLNSYSSTPTLTHSFAHYSTDHPPQLGFQSLASPQLARICHALNCTWSLHLTACISTLLPTSFSRCSWPTVPPTFLWLRIHDLSSTTQLRILLGTSADRV